MVDFLLLNKSTPDSANLFAYLQNRSFPNAIQIKIDEATDTIITAAVFNSPMRPLIMSVNGPWRRNIHNEFLPNIVRSGIFLQGEILLSVNIAIAAIM